MTDRKMKTLEDSLQIDSGVVDNQEVIESFHRIFSPIFDLEGNLYPEIFSRVGDTFEEVTFKLRLEAIPSSDEIRKINLPEFSRSSLFAAQKYRSIRGKGVNGNYLAVEEIRAEGSYIIGYGNKTIFKIDIENRGKTKWVANHITIEECRGNGIFTYSPNLDNNPRTVKLETSVPLRAKGNREKLSKGLFIDFHKDIKDQYQVKGATDLNEPNPKS